MEKGVGGKERVDETVQVSGAETRRKSQFCYGSQLSSPKNLRFTAINASNKLRFLIGICKWDFPYL